MSNIIVYLKVLGKLQSTITNKVEGLGLEYAIYKKQ